MSVTDWARQLAWSIVVPPVAAAILALVPTVLWLTTIGGVGSLEPQLYENAMEDPQYPAYQNAIMAQVQSAALTVALPSAAVVLMAAAAFALFCGWQRIAVVGSVRRLRPQWWLIGAVGVTFSLLWAVLSAFLLTPLFDLVTSGPALLFVIFVLISLGPIYYATSLLCTHRVYRSAIPWAGWLPGWLS